MKVWVDGQCLQSPSRYRGIGRYVLEFLRAVNSRLGNNAVHVSLNAQLLDEALLARELLLSFLPPENIHIWHGVAQSSELEGGDMADRALSQLTLQQHILSLSPDIALCASPFEGMSDCLEAFLPSDDFPIPTAALFYDAIPHRLPQLYLPTDSVRDVYYRRLKKLNNFSLLLSISAYAADEARELFYSPSIGNIGAGVSASFIKNLETLSLSKPVSVKVKNAFQLLYVGGLDLRKNVQRLVEAIGSLEPDVGSKINLTVVGDYPTESRDRLLQMWVENGLATAKLDIRGFLSDRELVRAYCNTDLVVQPSLLEGFGLTALEALQTGSAVIVANTGALPEVVALKELQFDPYDTESIRNRLAWAMTHADELKYLVHRAAEQSNKFTWDATANVAISLMKKASKVRGGRAEFDISAKMRAITTSETDISLLMASADMEVKEPPVLFVDITSTARIDHKTGIQRVVRKVFERSNSMRGDVWTSCNFIGSHQESGFFETSLDIEESSCTTWDQQRDQIVGFSSVDTVLMLDSSWEFYHQHANTLKLARLRGTEVYSVLYDLVPVRLSAFCDAGMPPIFRAWLEMALQYSTGFICISKAVADELLLLLEAMKYPRKLKIGYWHLGADFNPNQGRLAARPKRRANTSPKFLSVGTIEPRKGQTTILSAFDQLWNKGYKGHLTFVGREGWGVAGFVQRMREHPELGRRLHWHSAASDEALNEQYNKSDALIAASYGEGFGLPIVEAQRLGIPVIASDLPVFREVSQVAGLTSFFEAGSADDLAKSILEFEIPSSSPSIEQSRVKNWDNSVDDLHAVVTGMNWYRIYQPAEDVDMLESGPIGDGTQTKAIAKRDRSAACISIISGTDLSKLAPEEMIVAKVVNSSGEAWSSQVSRPGCRATMLVVNDIDVSRTEPILERPFPIIVPNGDTQYLAIGSVLELVKSGARSVKISVWQEGVGSIGVPITLDLSTVKETV